MVKSAPSAHAPSWAKPNNVLRLCVAQARGLLSVYKSRGSPFAPLYLCTGNQSRAHDHTKQGRGRMPEHKTSRATPRPDTQREQEGEVGSPGKTLAGVASAASARSLPGQLT